jgi:hypothetical protein
MQMLRRSMVPLLVSALWLVVAASPASAHYTYKYFRSDFASISSDHKTASVCNQTADGTDAYVHAHYNSNGQQSAYFIDYSANGSCRVYGPFFRAFTEWRLCRGALPGNGTHSCSGWTSPA